MPRVGAVVGAERVAALAADLWSVSSQAMVGEVDFADHIDLVLERQRLGAHREAYVAALTEKLPQRRLGTAEEAGAAVVFLMSNGFMNGETLHVDGGARLV